MRTIKFLVVHCTATSRNTSLDSIRNYWCNRLKWEKPGYHVIVKADGTAIELLSAEQVANGVKGFNSQSLHISYIGGVDAGGKTEDTRTTAQKVTLLQYLRKWRKLYPEAIIQGHRDFPGVSKACPSFNAKKEYEQL